MSRDLLSEATRALREAEAASELEARAARARLLSSLHQMRVRRRTRLAFILPIAATFMAASAWGAASGQALLLWQRIEQITGISAQSVDLAPSTRPRTQAQAMGQSVLAPTASALAPALDAPAPAAAAETQPAIPLAPARTLANSAPAPLPANRPEAADPALALYRIAHSAHFVEHHPTRALAGWDAYLAAAPHGAFAPEARYNRALSLLRLGRSSEARAALAPFANDVDGGYRTAEARALLERLDTAK